MFNADLFDDFFSDLEKETEEHYKTHGKKPREIYVHPSFWNDLLNSTYSIMRYRSLTGKDLILNRPLTDEELKTLFTALGYTSIRFKPPTEGF